MRIIPRIGDVFWYWYDTGAFGHQLTYGRITAVSKSRRSVRFETECHGVTGWRAVDRVLGGGLGGRLAERGEWTAFGKDEEPPCAACDRRPTRDPDTNGLEYNCACMVCPRCRRVYHADDPGGPQVASTDELAAKYDRGNAGMCALCWCVVDVIDE